MLRISVFQFKGEPPVAPLSCEFNEGGGTIGRESSNASSVGRALDCDSSGHRFEPGMSPQNLKSPARHRAFLRLLIIGKS